MMYDGSVSVHCGFNEFAGQLRLVQENFTEMRESMLYIIGVYRYGSL